MPSGTVLLPRGLTILSLLVVTFWGISEAQTFLIPICIAALLAFLMAPLVRVMRSSGFPEWSAITVSSILLVLPFLTLFSVLVWQGQALARDFPSIMAALNRWISAFVHSSALRKLHVQLPPDLNIYALLQRLEGSAMQGVQFLITGLGAVLGAGSQLALILLFAVLMLASRRHLRLSSERILKQTMATANPQILDEVIVLIEKFLIARLLIVVIVAAVDTAILVAFDVDYSLLLGSFLGVMTLIPVIGFLIGVLPPLVVSLALGHGMWQTLGLFLALLVISFVEGNILTPKMVGGRLNINALTTFVGLFGGGLLWGMWGMFLSIPVLGILRITFYAAPSLRPWGELLAEKEENSTPILLKDRKAKR